MSNKSKRNWLLGIILAVLGLGGGAAAVYFITADKGGIHKKHHRADWDDEDEDDDDWDDEDDDDGWNSDEDDDAQAPDLIEEVEEEEEAVAVPVVDTPVRQQETTRPTERVNTPTVDPVTRPEEPRQTRTEEEASYRLERQREVTERREDANENTTIYDVVEQMPQFPGGDGALMTYLANNISYPTVAEESGIQGRVVCTFVVERDGSTSDIRVVRSVDPSLDREAIRVIQSMPRWTPGRNDGQTVRVKYTLPITFRLE